MDFLTYLFWPNPGNAGYTSPKAVILIVLCILLALGSVVVSRWRKATNDAVLRKLSRGWPTAMAWFGATGLLLVIARVESIQYIAMRFIWLVWFIALVAYLTFQIRNWKARYYEVLPKTVVRDPRSQYLPKRKKR